MNTLQFVRGDSPQITFELVDNDDQALNITDATVFFTVKKNICDADDDAIIAKTITDHTDPENGKTLIELTPEDTENLDPKTVYVWDVQIKFSNGQILSPEYGQLKVTPDVTRRTA